MIEHSIGNKYTSVMDTLMEHFNKTMGPDGQSTSVTSKDHETPDVSRQVVDDHVTDFDDDQKRSGKNRDQENDLTDSTHVRRPQPKPRRSKLVSNSTVDGAVIQPKARPRSMIGQDIENKYTSVMGTLMGHFNKTSDTDDQSAKGPPRDCETPNLPHQADARHSDAEDCDRTVTNKAGESDCRGSSGYSMISFSRPNRS